MPVKRRKLLEVEPPKETPVDTTVGQRLYRIPQAAAYLGCSVWAVRDLLRRKAVAKIKLGKKFLVDRADLDRWIEGQKAA